MLICLRISQRFSLRLRSRLCLLWGGVMRVPCHGAVYPISPYSDMTARLQQSSILDWAQSQHQSAASGTGVVVANSSHIILMLPCRRSSHGDSYLSLRSFALGLRADNRRLLEPISAGLNR